jgi:patatin-like phospholipase/acyl hydrolase
MTLKILCINGGAIKGLYSLHLLNIIEKNLGNGFLLKDYFNILCGSSIGSIFVVCIALGMSTDIIIEMFYKFSQTVFKQSKINKLALVKYILKRKYKSFYDIFEPIYIVSKLYDALDKIVGNMKMKDLKIPIYIPSYCISQNKTIVFSNTTHPEYKIIDVLLAATAAPTLFPIHKIKDDYFIDGALWANCPIMIGVSEMLINYANSNYNILSIGNIYTKYDLDSLNKYRITSLTYLLNILFVANEQGNKIYYDAISGKLNKIIHFDGTDDFKEKEPIAIDDSSHKTLAILKLYGEKKGFEIIKNKDVQDFFNKKISD